MDQKREREWVKKTMDKGRDETINEAVITTMHTHDTDIVLHQLRTDNTTDEIGDMNMKNVMHRQREKDTVRGDGNQ